MAASKGPISWAAGWRCTFIAAAVYAAALGVAHLLRPDVSSHLAELVPGPGAAQARDASAWWSSWAPLHTMPKQERLQLLVEENEWKNELVMWLFPEPVRAAMPRIVQTWVRCAVLCAAVYFAMSGLWVYYAYHCFGDKLFKPGTMPEVSAVMEQIKVSTKAIPLYSMLPAITEFCAEKGWTMAYPRVENMGLPMYFVYFVLYMASIEFGVYWMHRGLHDIKWGYRLLHSEHHKYNKEHTLSPFAGLAFHPLDGILQAVPYTLTLFFCPMHFLTHEILLFFTGVWTTNIHDNLHAKIFPIMGAGYHSIHHTSYKHNYGHYFVFMDQMYGTMLTPEEEQEERDAAEQQQQARKAAAPQPRQQAPQQQPQPRQLRQSSEAAEKSGSAAPRSRSRGRRAIHSVNVRA